MSITHRVLRLAAVMILGLAALSGAPEATASELSGCGQTQCVGGPCPSTLAMKYICEAWGCPWENSDPGCAEDFGNCEGARIRCNYVEDQ